MSKVLFVKANNRPIEQSVSVKLYHAFLDSYKESHPNDEVVELDLFAENLPYYDVTKINAMYKSGQGMELTAEEQKAADLVNKYLNQFLEADKVVFAFPLWNFTVPAVLHTYIDYLCQAGKTFKYTPEGPVGLLNNKKVALLNARGGIYSEGPAAAAEMAVNFVQNVLGFLGVKDISTVIVEGHNQFPDKAEAIVQEGLEKAAKLAETF
ncbi:MULTISPECIES: FMN-dependent NADH-azoreductase [Bacillales]|jgi:FMN-dependent NADH-azoreductase|uniref:FMN dependent NADH:quinone oxidoreductase n=1 Tax=Brevibacillus aydinogluensis TaxID=927786 RepID=A0AA48MCP8_9BACL|nr:MULTISPECIES: FMN-dependent NADH-azoreductase [Bacillales]MBR8660741.1 FMN-dependent NADH-azoreductase [Brevibacillus sp. NL20B1]NNV03161.1 FMN-dependent NADH-azoreductase [Brevibacillus sp. MCWH]UFJ62482.1 FMN-dependent NADH-azoreductase [Anoxybacillus sediminis]CAJ1004412.1 FMN dependent NADH:quinone oxidoreductase [Brevibacillus aydinogluensis]